MGQKLFAVILILVIIFTLGCTNKSADTNSKQILKTFNFEYNSSKWEKIEPKPGYETIGNTTRLFSLYQIPPYHGQVSVSISSVDVKNIKFSQPADFVKNIGQFPVDMYLKNNHPNFEINILKEENETNTAYLIWETSYMNQTPLRIVKVILCDSNFIEMEINFPDGKTVYDRYNMDITQMTSSFNCKV
jgi:hypothetical protein